MSLLRLYKHYLLMLVLYVITTADIAWQGHVYGGQEKFLVHSTLIILLFLLLSAAIVFYAVRNNENLRRQKTDFLTCMNHEIRTPLTAISGVAEIFANMDDGFNEKQKQLIKILNSSTSDLKGLIRDISDYTKIEKGELALDQKDFDLHSMFEHVMNASLPRAKEKTNDFVFDYSATKKETFTGDRARLQQILLYLIGNSLKRTNKGSIIVTASKTNSPSGPFLSIEIKDTGFGPEDPSLLFDPALSPKYGGKGLEMPLSRQLARLMGGDILVETAEEKDSGFRLMVPFKTAA